MSRIESTIRPDDQKATVEALQSVLVDLIDLGLAAKQAHWNIVGRQFRSIHLQLDEVVDAARTHTDIVAERAVALGGHVDGRAETVARDRSTAPMPSGRLRDLDGAKEIVDRLQASIKRTREQMRVTEESDPPSQDLLNTVLHDLEKQHWMLQAVLAE